MREVIITRPRRFECSAAALRVEVNGRKLGKLKNGQQIVMQLEDAAQEITLRGGFLSGRDFRDTLTIPAGPYSYHFQVDFISGKGANYLPLLRPFEGEFVRDDTRTVTLLGATLCKVLLSEQLRAALRQLPGAQLQLVIGPADWRLLLHTDGAAREVYRGAYSQAVGGVMAAMLNTLEHGGLATPEGRKELCAKVMADYAAFLPDYERAGEDRLAFKG